MREIVAICESKGRSALKAETVLDRYFWRIGRRTWRGRASNACLARVSSDLKAVATRATAVAIHEIRSASASRTPIIRIGSKAAFAADGTCPVSISKAGRSRPALPSTLASARACLRMAALFHDAGKATRLFQVKLDGAIAGKPPEADAVRHELVSTLVWDALVGKMDEATALARLQALEADAVTEAFRSAGSAAMEIHAEPQDAMTLESLAAGGWRAAVGHLVLTHHRLPDGNGGASFTPRNHVRDVPLTRAELEAAPGTPFWEEEAWIQAVRTAAADIREGDVPAHDFILRTCLMAGDQSGSALKTASATRPAHLANTISVEKGKLVCGDSLSRHVRRVSDRARAMFGALVTGRNDWPDLPAERCPSVILRPSGEHPRFAWQAEAARRAAVLAAEGGGFFACLIAGTGTGKTRGAPAVLAAATFADSCPERRGLRFSLGLGLRTLADQSGREYVSDLGFSRDDVAVMIGTPPLEAGLDSQNQVREPGSESLEHADPAFLAIRAGGDIPADGSEDADWLKGLSYDPARTVAECIEIYATHARDSASLRRFLSTPIAVMTVDHLTPSISPLRGGHVPASMRVLTSDLILDEIDQMSPEDLAALGRLAWQTGAAGRRLVIMSATLTPDVAHAFHAAYRAGWTEHAALTGAADQVGILVAGDAPGSCVTGRNDITGIFRRSSEAQAAAANARPALRPARVGPDLQGWDSAIRAMDTAVSRLHDDSHVMIQGFRVSIGFVRTSLVRHAVAVSAQLPAGVRDGRLRLKACLHSRMPAFGRARIEAWLKEALTRKGEHPDRRLEERLETMGIFAQARAAGVRDIELVIVCTPVIETGNDIDFDWAILEPVSSRAVVQAAGRVRRHREGMVPLPNVEVLEKPLQVLERGRISRPGIETRPHPDTRAPLVELDVARDARTLLGEDFLAAIRTPGPDDKSPILQAEARARNAMLAGYPGVEGFSVSPHARLSASILGRRRFRRSSGVEAEIFCPPGGEFGRDWIAAISPGTRHAQVMAPRVEVMQVEEQGFLFDVGFLQPDLEDLSDTAVRARTVLRVHYDKDSGTPPAMTWHPFLGALPLGSDPLAPFGTA